MTQSIVENLKILSKSYNNLLKLIDSYETLKKIPVDNAYMLEKKLNEMIKIARELPELNLKESISNWVKCEENEIEQAKEEFRFKFSQELKMLLEKDGHQLRGQYPLLRIGLYTIKLDFEFGEAILYFGPEIEKLKSKIPLQPEIITETIKKYNVLLFSEKTEPEQILDSLYQAYKNRIALTKKSWGDKLLLTEVLSEFVVLRQPKQFFIDPKKENFQEYPRVKLSFLLYILKRTNLHEHGLRLHVATFDATTNKLHSLWIPENEEGEGTYYSYISFEKVQNTLEGEA